MTNPGYFAKPKSGLLRAKVHGFKVNSISRYLQLNRRQI